MRVLRFLALGCVGLGCGAPPNANSPARDYNYTHWLDATEQTSQWTLDWVEEPDFQLALVQGKDTDRVVIERLGDTPANSAAFYVADGSLLEPQFDHLTALPNTRVATGELVALREDDGTPGQELEACQDGVISCAVLGFGISNSSGEAVWLLDAQMRVLDRTAYPGGLSSGQCWIRHERLWRVESCAAGP